MNIYQWIADHMKLLLAISWIIPANAWMSYILFIADPMSDTTTIWVVSIAGITTITSPLLFLGIMRVILSIEYRRRRWNWNRKDGYPQYKSQEEDSKFDHRSWSI